jgi:hypothetical protein
MPALVAGIHALTGYETKDVDGRDVVREDGAARLVPGHDARGAFANLYLRIFASASSMSLDRKTTGHASQQISQAKEIRFQRLRKPHK